MKEDDESVKNPRTQVAAFENPGYDVAGAYENNGGIVAVSLSPFEEISGVHAVSNPVYDDIGMKEMSPQQSSHTEGAMANEFPKKEPLPEEGKGGITTVDRNKNSGTQEETHYSSLWANAGEVSVSNPVYDHIGMKAMSPQQSSHTEGAMRNELPKKEPLPEEGKAEITTVDRNKNSGTQEEPHYSSLWANAGEVSDKDQVKIDIQGENTYQSLEGHHETVVALEEGNPVAKTNN